MSTDGAITSRIQIKVTSTKAGTTPGVSVTTWLVKLANTFLSIDWYVQWCAMCVTVCTVVCNGVCT